MRLAKYPHSGVDGVHQADGEDFVARLYREHGRVLLAYVRRLVDDPALADDVVQDTLLRAWRHRHELDPDRGIRRWLLTTARDIVLSHWWGSAVRPAEAVVAAVAAMEAAALQGDDAPPGGDAVLQRTLRQVRAESASRRRDRRLVAGVAVIAALALGLGMLTGRQFAGEGEAAAAVAAASRPPAAPPAAPPADAPTGAGELAGTDPAAELATVQDLVKKRRPRLGYLPYGSVSNTCVLSHRNSDNLIAAPRVVDAAVHLHDYYGNVTTNAFSTVESLLAAGRTTCRNPADLSAYWVPALLRDGKPVTPDLAAFVLRGYDQDVGEVVPMPRGLKMIAGKAKAVTATDSNAHFSCTGAQDVISLTFPTCPAGSRLVRVQDFPSCWDGVNLDSADHRTHVVFPLGGTCPAANPVPLPRLRFLFVYPISDTRGVTVSSAPQGRGLSFTDHADAINLYPKREMIAGVRDCINAGIPC